MTTHRFQIARRLHFMQQIEKWTFAKNYFQMDSDSSVNIFFDVGLCIALNKNERAKDPTMKTLRLHTFRQFPKYTAKKSQLVSNSNRIAFFVCRLERFLFEWVEFNRLSYPFLILLTLRFERARVRRILKSRNKLRMNYMSLLYAHHRHNKIRNCQINLLVFPSSTLVCRFVLLCHLFD